MQIQHLSDSVYAFINTQLPRGVGYQCYSTFYLAERLGLHSYDETFTSLIAIDDGVEMDDVRDIFVEKVRALACEVIESHHITIDEDAGASLEELIEILHFLELVQRLEDYDVIAPRLFGLGSSRQIFVDMLAKLTNLEVWSAMRLIAEVSDSLIEAMRKMVQERTEADVKPVDHAYQQDVVIFADFLGTEQETLGLTMYRAGFTGLMWDTLVTLIPTDLDKHFPAVAESSVAQAALDFVSLALVCKDTYQTPLIHLGRVIARYIEDPIMVTKIHDSAVQILRDYTVHKQVYIERAAQNSEGA